MIRAWFTMRMVKFWHVCRVQAVDFADFAKRRETSWLERAMDALARLRP